MKPSKARLQKPLAWIPAVLILIGSLFSIHSAAAQPIPIGARQSFAPGPEASADKTLSPYFFVQSDDPALDQLPLKSTSTEANIAGVIADVTVTQVYKNEGRKPIEAIYVFPASTRAAVYGMKMTLGERTITARIEKREEARQSYEKAKQEGRSASLLEQQRPNVFQMNVANILPGDEIKTELRYTELLVSTDSVYEFVYPTVVGPRYSNQKADQAPPSEQWSQNPYLHEGQAPPNRFAMHVNLAAGLPIQDMTCPSHKVDIRYGDKSRASVELDPSEEFGGDRDFILKYRLAGDQVESGLLLYEGDKENFFLLMMQPPKRVVEAAIPPREYVFIVDVSGSMHGYPLEISKKLLKDLLGGLRRTDTFNVLLFSGGSQLLSEHSLPAEPEAIRRAVSMIDQQQGGGGTELLPALKRALALPRTEGVSRTLVIATDGYVTVEPEAFDFIRTHIGDANFFPFGIGTSVNRFLIEGMARVGAGEPFIITKPEEAPARAEKFRRYIQYPVLTGTHLDFGGFDTYEVEPAAVPDLFAERPVVVFGKWRGKLQGTIRLTGRSGDQALEKTLDVAQTKPLTENAALSVLWARARIARLSDYNALQPSDDRVRQVTELGLQHSLLTAYTSFVAIDSEVRRKGGTEELTTVKQPLPLPQGVSDYALPGAGAPMAAKMLAAPPRVGTAGVDRLKEAAREAQPSVPDTEAQLEQKDEQTSRVTIEKLSVEGDLPEAILRQVIERHRAEIERCWRQSGGQAPPETFTIRWTIGPRGTATEVELVPAAKEKAGLLKCLAAQIRKWNFPASKEGKKTVVTVTLKVESR